MFRFSSLAFSRSFCHLLVLAMVASLSYWLPVSTEAQEIKVDRALTRTFSDLPTPTDPGEPVQLIYKANKGEQWKYRTRVDVEMDVMGMVMPKIDENLIEVTIESVDENGFQFATRILEFVSGMETRGGTYRIDTAHPENETCDPPFRPLVALWREVAASTLNSRSTPQGKLVDFEVPKRIVDAVEDSGDAFGISSADLSAYFLTGFYELPVDPVSVGDQWDISLVIKPLGIEDATQSATFLGTAEVEDKNLALYQFETTAEREDQEGMMSDVEINSTTLVLFDLDAGNIWRTYSVTNSEMVLNMADNEVPQVATGTYTVFREDE